MEVQHSSECKSEALRAGAGEDRRLFTIGLGWRGGTMNESLDGSEKAMKAERRIRIAGAVACVSAIAFAIPHFWFYFGVSLAYPGDFPSTMPNSGALLLVGGFALLAAAYAISFTHLSFVRRLPRLIVTLPAWFGAVGFTLWGLAFFAVQIALALGLVPSTSRFATQNAESGAAWGYYWYSLFILWGLSLGTAAFFYRRLKESQEQSREDGKSRP